MLSHGETGEIKVLACQGKGVREIACELGVSRNTVRRYLRGAERHRCEKAGYVSDSVIEVHRLPPTTRTSMTECSP